MRIAIITDETDTDLAGVGNYSLNLTDALLKIDKKNEYTLFHRKKEKFSIYAKAEERIIPYNPRFPFSTFRNFITLPRQIKKGRFNVVHHPSNIGPFVIKQLRAGKKQVQTVHDVMPLILPEAFEFSVKIAFRHLLPRILRNVEAVLADSEKSKEDIVNILNYPEERIVVAYLAPHKNFRAIRRSVSKAFVKKRFGLKDNYILFVSSLEAKKDVPTAIRAFAKAGGDRKLVLVGRRGYGYHKIAVTIQRLGLKDKIVELGHLKSGALSDDLPMLYSAADLFVFPSLYEGFGMPVTEAQKCGCPVIASNGGSLLEVLGNSALLSAPGDLDSLTNNMKEALNSSATKRKLIARGYKNSKRFTWEGCAKAALSAYNN